MLIRGDARSLPLKDACVDCVVTSPPYWGKRQYPDARQIGLEMELADYIDEMVGVFREVRRVLKPTGTVWLNLGDSYHSPDKGGYKPSRVKAEDSMQRGNLGSDFAYAPNRMPQGKLRLKPKDLCLVPARVALALQSDGWWLRRDITWAKGVSFCRQWSGSCMPENVADRPSTSHEALYLLTKAANYYYDAKAVQEQGVYPAGTRAAKGSGEREGNRRAADYAVYSGTRNLRSVWAIPVEPSTHEHQAPMPEALVEPCILAGCPTGGIVLDPFVGTGTVPRVAQRLGRRGVGVDLSYQSLAKERTAQQGIPFVADEIAG
jgi:DNA modification methylase